MSEKDEIIFGAGELYLNEFTGNTIPEDEEIETDVYKRQIMCR